jgi:hypothetical protein
MIVAHLTPHPVGTRIRLRKIIDDRVIIRTAVAERFILKHSKSYTTSFFVHLREDCQKNANLRSVLQNPHFSSVLITPDED